MTYIGNMTDTETLGFKLKGDIKMTEEQMIESIKKAIKDKRKAKDGARYGGLLGSRLVQNSQEVFSETLANMGYTLDEILLWANSRPGRRVADAISDHIEDLVRESIKSELPGLKKEVAND